MRPALLTLLCGLIVVPAALAAGHATGDGVLELKAVTGQVAIGSPSQPAKGALWGQMDKGILKATDPTGPSDGAVLVSAKDLKKTVVPSSDGGPRTVVYSGHNLHFRVTGGKYRLMFVNAVGVDLTAIGVGVATLTGDSNAVDPGSYAVDDNDWQPVPVLGDPAAPAVVPFGLQPSTPPATTTTTASP